MMHARTYNLILIVSSFAVFSAVTASSIFFQTRGFMRDCSPWGYTQDRYLAYCESDYYGDYEHGAIYFGEVPEAVENIRRAEVLFFGSSRVQFGFSTRSTISYFSHYTEKTPFYLLGFGFGELHSFPEALIKKIMPHPKAAVINVDDAFFRSGISPPAKKVLDDPYEWTEILRKHGEQLFQRFWCDVASPGSDLCRVRMGTIYRSRKTGIWSTENYRPLHVKDFKNLQLPEEKEDQDQIKTANEFIKLLGIPANCVIFVTVPAPEVNPQHARNLAKSTGATFIPTSIPADVWQTLDDSHLTPPSAEKWSEGALQKLKVPFEHCGVK